MSLFSAVAEALNPTLHYKRKPDDDFETGFQTFQNNISSIESKGSGGYSAIGVKTKVGRALGKYQVMEKYLPDFSKQFLGRVVSPKEFLSNPQLQEQLFRNRVTALYRKYRNWADVASIWHSGVPLAQAKAEGRKDSLGTSTSDYAARAIIGTSTPSKQITQVRLPAHLNQQTLKARQFVEQAGDTIEKGYGAITEAPWRLIAEALQRLPAASVNIGKTKISFDPSEARKMAERPIQGFMSQTQEAIAGSGLPGAKQAAPVLALGAGLMEPLPGPGKLSKVASEAEKIAAASTKPTQIAKEGALAKSASEAGDIAGATGGSGRVAPSKSTPNASPQSYGTNVGSTIKRLWTDTVEYVQNEAERVRQLTNDKKLPDASNPYQKMTLYHGRVGSKIQEGYDKAQEIADDLVSYVGRNKTDLQTGRSELNSYLQALHAPERNAALGEGAAGITTDEAKTITDAAKPPVKAIAQKALDLNHHTLDMLHESGVISDDLFSTLREKYKNHVPLQRVMDESDDIGSVLSGKGFDVKGTGIKTAKGSDRQVADILTNIVNNYEQAVLRSEKNIVDSATLAFVRENEKDVGHLFEITRPKSVGTSHEGTPLLEHTNDPSILQLYEKGKPVWIKVKDPKLAIALRGVGKEKLGGLLTAIGKFTRLYSGLATRFNPEFALPNKMRDLQETFTYLASQGDVGFKGAFSTLAKDAKSTTADVIAALAGKETAGAKLYNEMKAAGGTTGGLGLSTRAQTELNIDKIFNTAASRPRQAAQKLVQYVDNWNTIFEDSTRLSVYKAALARGLSKDRAAFLAKEASINFNRMGKGGPVINALWMFSNASIQGSTKMLRAMKDPKVAAAVTTAVGGSVAAISEWNDRVDPKWRDHVTDWDRMNSLPIMLPTSDGSARYMSIPVSWGLKPILVMTNAAYDALSAHDVDPKAALGDVLSSVVDAYNPAGGTDAASAITPTIGDIANDIRANKSWSGAKIRPDSDPYAPKDIQYFSSLKETGQGQLAIEAAKKTKDATGILMSPADINYVLDQFEGGAGRSIKKTANLLYGFASGDVPPADEWPFVSRFLRERAPDELGSGTGGNVDKLKALLSEQSRDRFELKNEAEGIYTTFKSLPASVAHDRFDALNHTNPQLAAKVRDIANDEKLGLNYEQRLIKALGVENGERAKYIADQLNALKSQDEKRALWDEYVAKKLITKDIAKDLKKLLVQ